MDNAQLLTISLTLVGTLFAILTGVIGWMGARVVTKQDEVLSKLDTVKEDLHQKITHIDVRLVRVETIVAEKRDEYIR